MKKIMNPWRRSVEERLQGKNHEGYNCFGCSPDNPSGHLLPDERRKGKGNGILTL